MTTIVHVPTTDVIFVGGIDRLLQVFEFGRELNLLQQQQLDGYVRCGICANDLVYLGLWDPSKIVIFDTRYFTETKSINLDY